jgi:hypothetical protein
MLNRDFKECVASFNAHGVEYLVVGGSQGRPRYPVCNQAVRSSRLPSMRSCVVSVSILALKA